MIKKLVYILFACFSLAWCFCGSGKGSAESATLQVKGENMSQASGEMISCQKTDSYDLRGLFAKYFNFDCKNDPVIFSLSARTVQQVKSGHSHRMSCVPVEMLHNVCGKSDGHKVAVSSKFVKYTHDYYIFFRAIII